MMVHCPHCDARARLVDFGVIYRPACLRCDRPLPMPPAPETPPAEVRPGDIHNDPYDEDDPR